MNHKIKMILVVCALVWLGGCASMSSLSPTERKRVAQMVIFEAGSIPTDSYQILGAVKGSAHKKNLYEASGPSSFYEAKQRLRIRAAKLGADAVINMVCEEFLGVDWGRTRFHRVVCVGDAIILHDKSQFFGLEQ